MGRRYHVTKSNVDGYAQRRLHRRREIDMSGLAASTGVTVVLVHGGFVDGSGWEGVYRITHARSIKEESR